MSKKSILVFVDWYEPGYRAGGPIQSIIGFVNHLSHDFKISVVTSNSDLHTDLPYVNITANQWVKKGKVEVLYLDGSMHLFKLIRHLRHLKYDWVYVNSFFSFKYSVLPFLLFRLKIIKAKSILIAPRGELKPASLQVKRLKKSIYLFVTKIFYRYHRSGFWHATSNQEAMYIARQFGENNIITIENLKPKDESNIPLKIKEVNELHVVFVSRIISYKNLLYAIKVLRDINLDNIIFSIYGPIESEDYYNLCMSACDSNCRVEIRYLGELKHFEVSKVFGNSHLFFFPTKGENFGHVIAEALEAGCPVLISDQTPWSEVCAHNAGWSFSLENKEGFNKAIREFYEMDNEAFQEKSKASKRFASSKINHPRTIEMYKKVFNS